MKIMDSGDDGECQIESVVSTNSKKAKQARLPFQTLSADSPTVNKKRKSLASPDVRNAKQAKVTKKENSFKKPKKTEAKDIVIDEEKIVEKSENTNKVENKMDNKSATDETLDSKNKKSTPGKGSLTKMKKPEVTLTKFFKVIDNKETKKDSQTLASKNSEETKKQNSKSKESSQKNSNGRFDDNEVDIITVSSDDQQTPIKDEKSKIIISEDSKSECKKKLEEINESKDSSSSKENENVNSSCLNETDKTDEDSDVLSEDSHDDDDDDDSSKSDTDSKKTEHEDTDSRDDVKISNDSKVITPTRNKLLSSVSREKKLTPKQIERKMEMQKKREMRERQRFEREKKLQEERENRKKEKEERRKEKEEKRKEREEKEKALKEQKKKEKELKELKRQAEIEQKQKEKEAKEEDRRKREEAKEEEKRKKEEERLEAERKKQKTVSNFVSFFVAKKPTETKSTEEESKVEEKYFMPFEVKADMRVAPLVRRDFTQSDKSVLDGLLNTNVDKSKLYINEIKSKDYQIRKSGKTWPFESTDDCVIIDDDGETSNVVQVNSEYEKHRAKLFLFEDNRRPPYWGTWRKKSKIVKPRKPFGKDTEIFDYEVDSDDEWEEEEPGESLHGSDDEKEKDEDAAEENDYDIDNDFMVPHGYLSEEEIQADEEDDEEDDELNPETQKKKLKILGEQFEAERNTKTKKLKPKVIGCVWLKKDNTYPENLPEQTVQFLTARHAWVREVPLTLTAPADADNAENDCGTPSNKHTAASSARKAKALEDAIPDLLRLFHGNIHNRSFLLKEFIEYLSKKNNGEKPILITKVKLAQKLKEMASWIACPEPGPMHDKFCWYVADEYRAKYFNSEKLPLPNQWTYCLTPKRKAIVIPEAVDVDIEKEKEKEKDKKTVPLITQFTKTLTAEEMQKQLAEKPPVSASKSVEKTSAIASGSKPTPPINRPPKRVSLISVPRGEPLPKSPRVSLIDKFVTKDNAGSDSKKNDKPKEEDLDVDDCMIIDHSDEKDENGSVPHKEKETLPEKSTNKVDSKSNGEVDMKSEQSEDVDMKSEDENDKSSSNESKNSDIVIVD